MLPFTACLPRRGWDDMGHADRAARVAYVVRLDSAVRGRAGSPTVLRGWQLPDSAPDRGGLLALVHKALSQTSISRDWRPADHPVT